MKTQKTNSKHAGLSAIMVMALLIIVGCNARQESSDDEMGIFVTHLATARGRGLISVGDDGIAAILLEFGQSGSIKDLREAIHFFQEAIRAQSDESAYHNDLALAYMALYMKTCEE